MAELRATITYLPVCLAGTIGSLTSRRRRPPLTRTTETGRRARVYRLTRDGRKRLKEIEESWATLTEGVKRVLRWA